MRFPSTIILACAFALTLSACTKPSADVADDEKKIIKIHEASRAFHYERNAKAMVEQFSDDMISVNAGKISKPEKESATKRFQGYFDSVEFKKWDDVKPPVIRFSDDHSVAYVIVDKLVVLETKDSVGNAMEATTHFAWVSIFRKQPDGDFKLECITSTNEEETIRKL